MTDYRQVAADVLLLGGTKSPQFLKTSLDALELELPNVRRMTLEGLDHLSTANDGKPEVVAGELERFFTQPRCPLPPGAPPWGRRTPPPGSGCSRDRLRLGHQRSRR